MEEKGNLQPLHRSVQWQLANEAGASRKGHLDGWHALTCTCPSLSIPLFKLTPVPFAICLVEASQMEAILLVVIQLKRALLYLPQVSPNVIKVQQ